MVGAPGFVSDAECRLTGQSTRTHKIVRALRALWTCAPVISNVRRGTVATASRDMLNSPEAAERAANLEAYRRRIIEERWLSTLILSVHLEIEAMLEALLGAPTSRRVREAGFARKLSECQARVLLEAKLASCLVALNFLRNELAHNLENRPTRDSLFRFIEAMSAMHPLEVLATAGAKPLKLLTFAQIRSHFSDAGAEELEGFIFFSLMLLRASVRVRVQPVDANG
jgi:hypothetical protein